MMPRQLDHEWRFGRLERVPFTGPHALGGGRGRIYTAPPVAATGPKTYAFQLHAHEGMRVLAPNPDRKALLFTTDGDDGVVFAFQPLRDFQSANAFGVPVGGFVPIRLDGPLCPTGEVWLFNRGTAPANVAVIEG